MDGLVSMWVYRWVGGQMDGYMGRLVGMWEDWCVGGFIDGWVGVLVSRWIDEWWVGA